MEPKERQLIEAAIVQNVTLRRLYARHHRLEEQLDQLEHRKFLSPEEELLHRSLKKEKLLGVDQMMAVIYGKSAELAA